MSRDEEPKEREPSAGDAPEPPAASPGDSGGGAVPAPARRERPRPAIPRLPSLNLPHGYWREMDRIRDLIGPIDRFAAIGEIGKMFAVTADILPKVDPGWLSIGQMARDVVASPALTAALGSGAASGTLARLFAQPGWTQSVLGTHAFVAEHRLRIMDFSAHIESVIPKFDGLVVLPEIGRSLTLANEAWGLVAQVTPEVPDALSTWRLHEAGRTTLGVSATGLLLSPSDEEWDDDGLIDASDDELIAGPEDARTRLRGALRELDPRLVNRLDGAWERVGRHGPDAASQAANSLVELLDWTLRLAAPDAAVVAWHTSEGHPGNELHQGRPTRSLRIRFVVRARPDAMAAEMYVNGLRELMRLLQGHKHAGGEQQLAALARLVPTVEAYLSFLLL